MVGRPGGRVKPIGETLLFMHSLWELTHALQVASKKMSRTLGVTGPHLATTLGIHPSTLSGVLARLENSGFISRATDSKDRRRARFHLTASGKRIDREKKGTVEAAVRRALTRAGDATVSKGTEMLSLIVDELTALT